MESANPSFSQQVTIQTNNRQVENQLSNKKMNMKRWIVAVLIMVIICGIVGYGFDLRLQKSKTNKIVPYPVPTAIAIKKQPTPTYTALGGQPNTKPTTIMSIPSDYATPTLDPLMATWKTYTDPSGFSFKYPPELWSIETNLSPDGNQEGVYFTIQIPSSKKDPLKAGFDVDKNTAYDNGNTTGSSDNETLLQIFQQTENVGGIVGQPIHTYIDGYPAIETKGGVSLEQYWVLAPGLHTPNAEYSFGFGNPQAGVASGIHNPYSESDPFVQQQLTNFHFVISSIRFPAK